MVGEPCIQLFRVSSAIALHRGVGGRCNRRILIVCHSHCECGIRRVAVNVNRRVGHCGDSHREVLSAGMAGVEGIHRAIVGCAWRRPSHDGTTRIEVVRCTQVTRQSQDGRRLIVGHCDDKRGDGIIAH